MVLNNWKEPLQRLERNKRWDVAIEFMQKVIEDNPNKSKIIVKQKNSWRGFYD